MLVTQSLGLSGTIYGAQRRGASDLARLLKRGSRQPANTNQQLRDAEEGGIYFDETAGTSTSDDDYLRLLSDIAALIGERQDEAAPISESSARFSLGEVDDSVLAQPDYDDRIVAAADSAEELLQNIDAAVAGLPSEDANRVALAYLLDAFDLDMQQADFELLAGQINNLEKAYSQLTETLASLQVQVE